MAETTDKAKKAKAPAKPRAAAGTAKKASTKKAAGTNGAPRVPTHDEIAHLARQYWAERGHQDGHAEQDWLRAERELMKQAS